MGITSTGARKCPSCKHDASWTAFIYIEEDSSIGQHDAALRCPRCGAIFPFTQLQDETPPEENQLSEFAIDSVQSAKTELLIAIEGIVGRSVPGINRMLRILTHPAIIEYTRRYINTLDKSVMCLKYEAPWSCAKEAEARYENVEFGWLGAEVNVDYNSGWCENCRKRVTE